MNKKKLALWGMMAFTSLTGKAETNENPAKLDRNTIEVVSKEGNEEGMEKVFSLKNLFAEEVKQSVDSLGVNAEFEPSDLDDLKDIQESINTVLNEFNKLKTEDYKLENSKNDGAVKKVGNFLEKLIKIQKDLDDFFAHDLEHNKNNSNIAGQMANYLANIVAPLQEYVKFANEAKEDLFSHEDLVGVGKNMQNSRDIARLLIVKSVSDPRNKINILESIPKEFSDTKKGYSDLLDIKKKMKEIVGKMEKELSKNINEENKPYLDELTIEFLTEKNIFIAKKWEILRVNIPKDLAKQYNKKLKELKDKNNDENDLITDYELERSNIMDNIISPLLPYLEEALVSKYYNLQEKVNNNNLDGAIEIIFKYLKENNIFIKYKTKDFDDLIRGKFKKGKQETFSDIDAALKSLRGGAKKRIENILKAHKDSENLREKIGEKSFKKVGKEEISKYLLYEINLSIYYLNAQNAEKMIQKSLDLDIKFDGKNPNNLKLETDRRKENALNFVFKEIKTEELAIDVDSKLPTKIYKPIDYSAEMKKISTEKYTNQPKLRKEIAEEETNLAILKNRLKKLEKGLIKSRENLELAGIDSSKDKNFANKRILSIEVQDKIGKAQSKLDSLKTGLKKSLNNVLGIWKMFEANDNKAFNKIVQRTAKGANKVDSLVTLVENQKLALKRQKEVYNESTDFNNAESFISRENTDLDLSYNAELLLTIERKQGTTNKELDAATKELKENLYRKNILDTPNSENDFMGEVDKNLKK